MLKIAIDSGHGLNTAGKEVPSYMGHGRIKEWELNDKIARKIIELLKDYEDVEILRLDDPTGRRDVPLKERTDKANAWGADLLISNHHNAGINGKSGGGLVVFRYPNSKKFTKEMQKLLYDCLIAETGLKGNRATPLAEANFHMLRESKMAAVLIEHGFMDSHEDLKAILQDDFAQKTARGIIAFLEKHYGIKKKQAEESGAMKFRTLRHGMEGEDVGFVQRFLGVQGFYSGPVDNRFGPGQGFLNAVKSFQKANGLKVDGIIGPATWAKIIEILLYSVGKLPVVEKKVKELEAELARVKKLAKQIVG